MAPSLNSYVTEYENVRRTRHGGQPSNLVRTQDAAFDRFLSLGFPTTRDEEWRFTSVAPIAEQKFGIGAAPSEDSRRIGIAPFAHSATFLAELVFINGHYIAELSRTEGLPAGVSVESLGSALARADDDVDRHLGRLARFEQQAFTALNTAFLTDGAFIHIPARTVLTSPIHVLFISSGKDPNQEQRALMSHPRVLVVAGHESQAVVVESYAGTDAPGYFTNAVTEIVLAENAVLDHYKMQIESAKGYHVAAMHVNAERNANLTSHSIGFGGSLVRNDVVAVLDGEGVECTLNGLYIAGDQRLVDNHTTIDHAKPHCGSREVYKGILADRARGVFNGKIIVRPDAQKTDAKQTNRALLLSEDAQINTKPQLEIFANDVKCTHGAAVGQLDDEAVFYLRSRGLSDADARRLLIHAFAADVLNRMALQPLRADVERLLQRQLAHAA